jgi:hypothetical protein
MGYLVLVVKIRTPFEDRTKAEVMALCRAPAAIAQTHSCISQRLPRQDGTCHGCSLRRLAALAAGVTDTNYARDPVCDASAHAGNLLAMLDFSKAVLLSRRSIPNYQRDLIDEFRKWDLFKRFALDNFAALLTVRATGARLAPAVEHVLFDVLSASRTEALLGDRLRFLHALKVLAD